MPEPLLRLRGISKEYPLDRDILGRPRHHLSAVDAVDLDVARGETLAVVGESGCGKSTLARLILRLIPATAGSVHYDGLDVLSASRGEIRRFRHKAQIVFQDPFGSLDPRMKVHSIIAEGMGHLGLSRAERRDRVRSCWISCNCPPPSPVVFRTSSPAGSGSESVSPARSPWTPSFSSPMSPSVRWTCPCRAKCSI